MQTAIPLRRSMMPFGLGVLIALGIALLLAIGWLGVRGQDMIELVYYLLVSSVISLGCGALGLAWFRRGHVRLWVQVTLTFTLGLAVAILNIFLTANLMFISKDHDLPLLILLMLFAATVSLALGYALAQALAQRVTALHHGAHALAGGDLAVRVDEGGGDELAALAVEFNRMAAQLAAAAEQRRQMETTRRELIAAISHDLRTPLASLRVMTEALADGLVEDQATSARYLATMRGQIGHLSSLIDDLFELAQIDAGALRLELQRASLADLVSDAIEGMRPQAAAKGVRLEGSVAPGIGPALIAPQKIERVLYNLVTNAVRHTPADGSVMITVSDSSEFSVLSSELMDTPERTQNCVVITVADTGEGIAPGDLPRIFEHFYRGEKSRSRATGGAGLGLAIARGIVEAHGGRIWASSQLERGTQIAFTLPLQPAARA
ncbi:MAG: ATP-binding protein [Roseiflexaceae bacterium]